MFTKILSGIAYTFLRAKMCLYKNYIRSFQYIHNYFNFLYVPVTIRAGVFYQDLKTRAEGEIFKSDKTQSASINANL